MKRRAGFTIVELLVATSILGIILVFVFGTMLTTQKRAQALDDTVDIQQAARQIADVVERDLRHTGMMVIDAAALCGADNKTSPDALYVTDWEAITPGIDLSPRLGAWVTGATGVPTSGTYFTVDSLVMEDGTPDPTYDTNGDSNPDSDFRVGGGVIIADESNPDRGVACGNVTGVTLPNQLQVTIVAGGLASGGASPRITAVPAIGYSVDANSVLYRGPYRIADNVEDLQVAWFFDEDENNVVDTDEYKGDGVGPDYTGQGNDASLLREVRLNLVLRTPMPDPEHTIFQPVSTENRTASGTTDGFRRRVYTSVVRLRNLGRRIEM
jgi:prepilin-type N-terminal cleavage/methylation domain-containing protein